MLSLVIEPHWSVVAYWLLEGLLSYTTNMPPEREASPNLQHYNLAIENNRPVRCRETHKYSQIHHHRMVSWQTKVISARLSNFVIQSSPLLHKSSSPTLSQTRTGFRKSSKEETETVLKWTLTLVKFTSSLSRNCSDWITVNTSVVLHAFTQTNDVR